MSIPLMDARSSADQQALARLRARLGPRGDVLSESSRIKTIEVFGGPLSPAEVVRRICEDVRTQGIDAVLQYSARLDGVEISAKDLRVPAAEIQRAHAAADPAFLGAVRQVRTNIRTFQSAILNRDVTCEISPGLTLQQRYRPLRRVGLCVPGGAAAYPSTLLMTAVPAQVACVDEIVVVAPPTANGSYNQEVLATCQELGLSEVYRVGGAQAVATLAYGIDGVPGVDKIVGPGNLFVALAKKYVYGEVDIDAIAGPSEVIVIADDSSPPEIVAAELLAQAEHAPGSSILMTWSEQLSHSVPEHIERQLSSLPRAEWARRSLHEFSAILLVRDQRHAAELCDAIAPEHVQLSVADPTFLAETIRNAGAIFIGPHTPVAAGDYAAGPSHVLPTGGTARFASGLTTNSFLRGYSTIQLTEPGLRHLAAPIETLAEKEGLTAHWQSVRHRLEPGPAG